MFVSPHHHDHGKLATNPASCRFSAGVEARIVICSSLITSICTARITLYQFAEPTREPGCPTIMIERAEIDAKSVELGVNVSNVQRDYIFGWVLAGLYNESAFGRQLILKGGNCLRKAYFPFGRFSPDLDFSSSEAIDESELGNELNRVCGIIQDRTGIVFDTSRTISRPKRSASDDLQLVEARVYFRDFYNEESEMIISVRMDISQFDRLYLPVQTRRLIHNYSDHSECQADIRCVKLEEQLASKLKCLIQRRHVADLYDFVATSLLGPEYAVNKREILTTFLRKTIFERSPGFAKGLLIDLPFATLRDFWDRFIVCPISARMDFDAASTTFRQLIDSIFGAIASNERRVEFFPAQLRNPIMNAGHSKTLLSMMYDGSRKIVEPYSLTYKVRKDGVAREYFYAYDRTGGSSGPGIKTFVASKVGVIENTEDTFEPRFPIELSKAGEVTGSLHFAGSGRLRSAQRVRKLRPRSLRRTSRRTGTYRYTIQCPVCRKRFKRDTYSSKLNKHKDKYGNRCIGRIGYRV